MADGIRNSRKNRLPSAKTSMRMIVAAAGALALGAGCSAAPPPNTHHDFRPPLVGWDTYRHLDQLPYLPGNVRSLEASSFDRSGGTYEAFTGNKNGSGGCLSGGGAGCVVAQDAGAGEISSMWFTNNLGTAEGDVSLMGNIRVELDGKTVLDAPLQAVVNGQLGAPFAFPLAANAQQAGGGVFVKVPMPYRESMRISVQSHLKYYHVNYRHFPEAGNIATFDPSDKAEDVLATLRAAGTRDPKPAQTGAHTDSHAVDIPPAATVALANLTGSGSITALRMKLPSDIEAIRNGLRLRVQFDGHQTVDSPVGEFFGSGLGPAAVRSLFFASDPNGWLSSWWPMPYGHSATISLVNTTNQPVNDVQTQIATAPDSQWSQALNNHGLGYFTAVSHAGPTVSGQDWNLDTEPGNGKVVGVNQTFRGHRTPASFSPQAPTFLEGAERVYVNGLRSPQLYGTGTEDFYEGGWYFLAHTPRYPGDTSTPPDHFPVGGTDYSDPFTGMPSHNVEGAGCPEYCLSAYRVLPADAITYQSGLQFGIEHGKRDLIDAEYSSTTFLYSQPEPAATGTDVLDLADPISRTRHAYHDPSTNQYHLVSQYEGTQDAVAVPGTIQVSGDKISFRLHIRPDNHGVLLRRISDQIAGNQSARVVVDDKPAGTWLQPRGNDIHRWLEDSYLLPESTTAGKTDITVTLTPTPGSPPWTASTYSADPISG